MDDDWLYRCERFKMMLSMGMYSDEIALETT